MANTTQAWLDYFRASGFRLTPERQRYAEAYGSKGQNPPAAQDPNSFLSGEDKNAYAALSAVFKDYGLADLAPDILMFLREGYDGATIELMLRETDSYKKRFAGNDDRKKAGLSTLSPAEYVAMERQYGQIMRAAGLPSGFYDTTDDFRTFIANDVSVNEVQQRVQLAKRAVFDAPQETRDALREFYGVGVGELTAYFLDPDKGMAVVDRQARAAEIAAGEKIALGTASQQQAERLADLGVTDQQARQGFTQIADTMTDAKRLSDLYGASEGTYDLKDAVAETFGDTGAADASKKRRGLASRERAAFSGNSGTAGADSLSTRRRGSL